MPEFPKELPPPGAKKPRKRAAKKVPPKKVAKPRAVIGPQRPPTPEEVLDEIERTAEIEAIEVIDPGYEAYRLQIGGMPWLEVSQRTGYQDPGAAKQAVGRWLARAAAEMGPDRRAMAMEMTIARHEAVLHAWWHKATVALDPAAAAIVSRELAALDKVQRLGESEIEGVSRTIVISSSPEEYTAQLRRLAEGGTRQIEQ